MDEYLKQMEYPPERGYDRKILESNCKTGPILANVTIVLPFAFWHAWQAHPSLG